MGQSRKRKGKNGKFRYTAYYDDIRGNRVSAGTYATEKEADKAWQKAEVKVSEGRGGNPARGRQAFRRYVEEEWFPNHVIEVSTREGYHYAIHSRILPHFGKMKLNEILPPDVREWIKLLGKAGMKPRNIAFHKTVLSAIFTTAFNDEAIGLHPCRGVRTPTVPKKMLEIITPEQFDDFHAALPDEVSRMLVEVAIESGMRWGELAELRPKDINLRTRILTISRTVVEVNTRFHPDGKRFLIKDYPKDKEPRRFKLSAQIITKLTAYIQARGLDSDDLLFQYDKPVEPARHDTGPTPANLGLTSPNAAGRQYRHGTPSGYNAGRCKCDHCRRAIADYRAQRRAAGHDSPRTPRSYDTDGHIPRRWFRDRILRPALETAKLDIDIVMKAFRHAHASWLLAGGADLQVVKERLGHGSIKTTEGYLHTLPDADDTALDAFSRIRRRAA
ncbi:site-specific integrase [Longispora sp. NPDC051575]|uniref:tyrosine-type recombinase/integrase n=1 Tax=Longispora sp. NPDC051575 TaxID=3154943 RepID=UPI00341ABFBF